MRRLCAAIFALALAGAVATLVSSPAAAAQALPHRPHHLTRFPAAASTPAAKPTDPPPPEVVNVTPTQASPGQTITVSGSGFQAGTRAQVYLDGPNHPLGSSVVVGDNGTFGTQETVPAGATVAIHQVCAQVNTQTPACAQLQVTPALTTPTPTPPPTAAPTPTATAAPATTPTGAATPPPQSGILGSLFPGILIPIAILIILAALAIVLIVRRRGSEGGGEQAPPLPTYGDPRGAGQPTVTHRSPRGYQGAEEPPGSPPRRGYRRRAPGVGGAPSREPLAGRDDRGGLPGPGSGGPSLPGSPPGQLPGDEQRGLPGGNPGSLPPGPGPRGLPPSPDGDDDDPFSSPPRR